MVNLYFVNFGGFSITTAESVHDENGRDISEYDSVGGGKFNVPDSRNPKTWEVKCTLYEDTAEASKHLQWRASEIFKACTALLENSTQPSRLIVSNVKYPSANLSVLAWLKNYQSEETYPGVYEVTFNLEEYKPVGVKTTGVPTVKRPGKIPVPAKVTITKKNTVYKVIKKYTGASATSKTVSNKITLKNPKTGKPATNVAALKPATAWNIGTKKGGSIRSPTYDMENEKPDAFLQTTFNSIGNAISKFITGHY